MTVRLNHNMDFERITIVLISFLAILIVISTIQSTIPISAQVDSTYALNNTIFVSGSATANTKADKVIVSLGVETTDKTAEKALLSNSNLMNKVIGALNESGVKQNDELIITLEHDRGILANTVTLPFAAITMKIVSSKIVNDQLVVILKQ